MSVDATPPQGIDRDALRANVIAILTGLASETADVEGAADRILALACPVDDSAAVVTEEFERMLADDTASIGWVHGLPVYTAEQLGHLRRVILERLEASS